jgi:hypothetical protein
MWYDHSFEEDIEHLPEEIHFLSTSHIHSMKQVIDWCPEAKHGLRERKDLSSH